MSNIIDDLNKSFPGCKIQIVPNVGFDIAPFFSILKKINSKGKLWKN